MNKQEAIQILAVQEDASPNEIKAKYSELYNEYQIRLTNAPTPNLKKLYQKNLQELNDALTFLLEGKTSGVINDLPSSTPVYESESNEKISAGFAQSDPKIKTKSTTTQKEGKSQTGVYIFAIISVVAIAFVILLIIFLNQKNAELDSLKNKSVSSSLCEKVLTNGKMKIKNVGKKSILLVAYTICYVDNNNEIKKVQKASDIIIKSGESLDDIFKEVNGGAILWDGSVVSYAFTLNLSNSNDPILYAGMWSEDNLDNEILLNLDNY